MIAGLSKRLWLVNVLLLAVAIFFGVSLARDLTRSRPLPPPPAPRRAQASAPSEDAPAAAAEEKLVTYNVIVAKHLFNPSRTEGGSAPTTPAAPPPPKPTLLGVVVDGPKSRAYLEDASHEACVRVQDRRHSFRGPARPDHRREGRDRPTRRRHRRLASRPVEAQASSAAGVPGQPGAPPPASPGAQAGASMSLASLFPDSLPSHRGHSADCPSTSHLNIAYNSEP